MAKADQAAQRNPYAQGNVGAGYREGNMPPFQPQQTPSAMDWMNLIKQQRGQPMLNPMMGNLMGQMYQQDPNLLAMQQKIAQGMPPPMQEQGGQVVNPGGNAPPGLMNSIGNVAGQMGAMFGNRPQTPMAPSPNFFQQLMSRMGGGQQPPQQPQGQQPIRGQGGEKLNRPVTGPRVRY